MALELNKHLGIERGFPTRELAELMLVILRRMGKPVEEPDFYKDQLTQDARAQAITGKEAIDDNTALELLDYLRD